MYSTPKRPPSQPRSPLGAFPNLQNDPRLLSICRNCDRTLSILVRRCDRKTAAVERRLSRIAEWCRVSTRTVRRHLMELARVGLIEYQPGNGRGNITVVRLLYETWGKPIHCHQGQTMCQDGREKKASGAHVDQMKDSSSTQKVDSGVPSNSQSSNEPARKGPEYCVESTPTLHSDTGKPASLSKAAKNRVLQFVYRFHTIAKTASHKLTPYLIDRECRRVVAIFDRYPDADRRRHAWRLMMRQYSRRSNREPMRSVALWSVFCRELPDIAAELRTRCRTKAYKRAKATGDIVPRSELRKLEAALVLELERSTCVPVAAIARSRTCSPSPVLGIKVAAWEREAEHEEQKQEREKHAPETGNILSQIMDGTTFGEWSQNNEGTSLSMSMRE